MHTYVSVYMFLFACVCLVVNLFIRYRKQKCGKFSKCSLPDMGVSDRPKTGTSILKPLRLGCGFCRFDLEFRPHLPSSHSGSPLPLRVSHLHVLPERQGRTTAVICLHGVTTSLSSLVPQNHCHFGLFWGFVLSAP